MAKKAFEIQSSDLKLGGVNLKAGTTGVVIPGITQATNYFVEEVEDVDGVNPDIFGSDTEAVQLLDNAAYLFRSGDETPSGSYSEAGYSVQELDDGEIEEIYVEVEGTFLSADKAFAEAGNMWATTVPNAKTNFNAGDWTQIAFRPKIRAGEVENVGGGSGIGDIVVNVNDDGPGVSYTSLTIADKDFNIVTTRTSSGNDADIHLTAADDIWIDAEGDQAHLSAKNDVIIGTDLTDGSVTKEWTFDANGNLTLPAGGDILDSNGNSVLGGSGSSTSSSNIYIMANVDGDIVTSTDGVTWGEPTPSGMVGISRLAVHGGTIVYAYSYVDGGDGTPIVPGLYYSTTIGTVELCTGTDVEAGEGPSNNIYWNQVRYFSEPNKWVAVGYVDGSSYEFPAVAYSDDGINWTVVLADNTFVTDFNNDEYNWPLTDIAWISETQKYVITSKINGPDWYGGIFVTSDLTVALDASVHVAINLNPKKVAPWPVTQFGGPTGYVMLWSADEDNVVWAGNGTDPEDYYSDIQYWADGVSQQIGYVPFISEVAYDEDVWIAVTDDGQVITPGPVIMGPPQYTVSVPLPYTTTDFSISRANPAVLTYNENNPELALIDNEKIVISGSDMFDGTYYYKASDDTLYTDQSLTTALDSSMFDPFVSGGTLTMSHGTYFDAAGAAGRYYYIGNDDEQVFRSTNGTTWTQLADVTGQYFNDFAYGTFTTEDTGVKFVQLADGSLQAQAASVVVASLSSALTAGKPTWLTVTPRSPDRETLDTHYGFDGSGMWFTGDNEETFNEQPAYPIHTTASFPADATAVVEFDINLVSGEEDWGVCVYPADGIPHWSWEQHPSRIAAVVDCSVDGDPYVEPQIKGFTDTSTGNETSDVARARFTYNPIEEIAILEVLNSSGSVTSRAELPGRLAPGQDYRIGFDGDWDEAGPNDKSYFTNLSITVGNTSITKTTEFSLNGEVKLPSTVKSFVNMAGPWINNSNHVVFHTVAAHNGFAYMGGEDNWGNNNNGRIDKYSLTTGELVWTRVLGAGRNASFDISWTGGVYTLDNVYSGGVGYKLNEVLYMAGDSFSGGAFLANNATITVTAVDGNGAVMTATIAGTAPSGTNSVTGATTYGGDAQGFPVSVEYDTVNDNLVLLSYQDSILASQAAVIRINPTNGDVVGNVTLTDEGDIYPYDLAVHPTTGATAVVGEKRNEYKEFGTLTMLATGNGYFDILKSNLDEEHWPGNQIPSDPIYNFLISGTGITGTESVDYVNYYEGVSSTTRQGSGAEFTVVANDGDPGIYTVTVTSGGSYYLIGHKIKILGTSLGGTTPANDLILTVADINPSLVVTASGSADGGAPTTYTGVTGTNYEVGSGMLLNVTVDTITGSITTGIHTAGSNYVEGDVTTILGTTYAHGATPTHDTEVTVMTLSGTGVASVVTGNIPPNDAIRIRVDGVDFTAVGGSWSMKQNLDGEAFVWTPVWNKAIGGGTNDRFQSVVYSKDGDSIYAVGNGYYETSYAQSLVVKFATSDGTIEFSKYLNSDESSSYATGVATIGTGDIVVSGYEYRVGLAKDLQFVARMTSSGTVVWKKFYGEGNWGSNSLDVNSDVQVDSDNNIYVTAQISDDNPNWANRGFTVTKLDSAGNILWTRCLSGNESSYLGSSNGNRWSSLHGDQLVMAGYTYETDDDYYNALWASLPTDGFAYLGGESEFVQMGAFRFSQGRIKDEGATEDVGGTFTPSVQPPNITAVTDLKKYETRSPETLFPQHLHKALDPKHGGLVFGDGTRQKTAGDQIPQIRADDDYFLTANDSGRHIYYKNNNGAVTIPAWWRVNLPVGFTFTIVNRTGSDCYVNLEWFPGEVGTILGAGRNIATPAWGIPDSGSGSMVTLIKLEDGHDYNNGGQAYGQVWMISGPSDIYDAD